MRLIDADAYEHAVQGNPYVSDSMKTYVRCSIQSQPTIDAIPIEWILNNERMPKEGKGRKAIMDMLEDWRKEHDTAD